MKPDFENWLYEHFAEQNPEILDDNLADATSDWIADFDSDAWIYYANKYAKEYKEDK